MLFDDGANLTVHLDPAQENGAWRMEVPLTEEETRALTMSTQSQQSERLVGRRRCPKARKPSKKQNKGGQQAKKQAREEQKRKQTEKRKRGQHEGEQPPLSPQSLPSQQLAADESGDGGEVGGHERASEFLVQLGQDATCQSVWLGDAELENEYPQLHQQLSQKGWDGTSGGDNGDGDGGGSGDETDGSGQL